MLTGDIPLTVTFTDTSEPSSGITYWLWDFGDGATSEDQNPTHLYESVGEYTVTLHVASAKGIDTFSDTVTTEDPNNRNVTSASIHTPGGSGLVGGTSLVVQVTVLPVGPGRTVTLYWRKSVPVEPESADRLIGTMSYNPTTERYQLLWTFPSCPALTDEQLALLHAVAVGGDGVPSSATRDDLSLYQRGC